MFGWFTARLIEWMEQAQRRHIAKLRAKNLRLKAQVEEETGEPIMLTSD